MQLSDTHNPTRSPEDTQREPPHGLTMSDGPENTSLPRAVKVINITSKKQAIWIRSLMRGKPQGEKFKPTLTQIVTRPGTATTTISDKDILASYPRGDYKSPMELDRLHPERGPVMMRRETEPRSFSTAVKTQDEMTAEAFSKPASPDCILAHLMRMTPFLHIKGAAKDDDGFQTTIFLSDLTTRLKDEKVLEVDIFLACEHFIETEVEGFFPTIAKFLKQVGKG